MRTLGRLSVVVFGSLLALAAWAALVGFAAREGWGRPMPAARGDNVGFLRWAEGRYAAESKGNFAMVLLDQGQVAASHFASHGRPVDGESLFQVASMSKWVTAWGVMTLVQQGRIDLDAPVSHYLIRWRLPPGAYDNDAVTVRRLLSHTAGLTDRLGFRGFAPGQAMPTIEQELTHAADAWPGASGITRVGVKPDNQWRYSGGGYLLLQLLIEDVTHKPFNDYMREAVLQPLGMTSSTFVDPNPAHLVDFYGPDGAPTTHYRFVAVSAASLYTSTADMTRFLRAQAGGSGVLTSASLAEMRTPQAFLGPVPVWGLGQTLLVPNGAGGYIVGHDGGNYPAINTTARVNPATSDGIVVLQTGSARLAARIGGEWVFWRTGIVPIDTLLLFDGRSLLLKFAAGAALILLAGGWIGWRWIGRNA